MLGMRSPDSSSSRIANRSTSRIWKTHLGDLVEQRRDVRRARERLRHLEQQRELLANTLLVRHDDRRLIDDHL